MAISRHAQSLIKDLAYRCGFSLRRLRSAKGLEVAAENADRIRPLLHGSEPYEDFDPSDWPGDASGWGSDSPAFGELIEKLRPKRIIEVGTCHLAGT